MILNFKQKILDCMERPSKDLNHRFHLLRAYNFAEAFEKGHIDNNPLPNTLSKGDVAIISFVTEELLVSGDKIK